MIKFKKIESVAKITLDRPDKYNSFVREMALKLQEKLDECNKDQTVRCILITGAGKAFSAGQDLKEAIDPKGLEIEKIVRQHYNPIIQKIRETEKPIIAAVNGVAAGAGLGIALASDIRIASTEARFGSVFVKRSLVPDTGVSQLIGALSGPGIAYEMSLTGNIYDADWALAKGLINEIVSPSQVVTRSVDLANQIACNPPLAVKATKGLMNNIYPDLQEVIEAEHLASQAVRGSKDRIEAVSAFLEKREPRFIGR